MSRPKVYIDNDKNVTIVFGKDFKSEECNVTIVHDRGVAITKKRSVFGGELSRFVYHCANAYGDGGYSSDTNNFTKKEFGKAYKLIRKK